MQVSNLQTQLDACIDYCQNRGYEVAVCFIEAYSGLTLECPKLSILREMVRAGEIAVVVCHSLDRLSRDPTHGVILTQEMEKQDVILETVTEDVDNSELGKLISYIRGFASKLEAEKIRERTTRSKAAHVKMGRLPIGTGFGVFSYDWDKSAKKRVVNEAEAKVVARIFEMLAAGRSRHHVAVTLNAEGVPTKTGGHWHPLTIHKIVTNPAYIGKTYYGRIKGSRKTTLIHQDRDQWVELPGITPPILTPDLFEAVQTQLQKAKEVRPGNSIVQYLLCGRIVCGDCGSPVTGTTLSKRYRYYRCRGANGTYTRGAICKVKYMPAHDLENAV